MVNGNKCLVYGSYRSFLPQLKSLYFKNQTHQFNANVSQVVIIINCNNMQCK